MLSTNKMTEETKVFFPLFYNTLELTSSLSNEEFGVLIRELLNSRGSRDYSTSLPTNLIVPYKFMLDNAIRIFNLAYTKRAPQGKKGSTKKESERQGDFDAEEAFQKALMRSYGTSEKY